MHITATLKGDPEGKWKGAKCLLFIYLVCREKLPEVKIGSRLLGRQMV